MLDRLRHLSHLSTITENQNSPYSTNPGTRRNSRSRPSYPTAEAIFNQVCMSTEGVRVTVIHIFNLFGRASIRSACWRAAPP